jgi:excisionase family DNA binding protein
MSNQTVTEGSRAALVEAGVRPDEQVLLRVTPDVTRITGLGKTTIWEAISRGELRAVRFGRAVRVHHDDLAAWIQANREASAA